MSRPVDKTTIVKCKTSTRPGLDEIKSGLGLKWIESKSSQNESETKSSSRLLFQLVGFIHALYQ